MKNLLLAVALIACSSTGAVAGTLTWIEFAHDAGAFKVKLPGLPIENIQTVTTEAGPVKMYLFTYEGEDIEYMVAYADYPAAFRHLDPDILLDGARDGFVFSTGGTLARDREIALADFPGRELLVETDLGHVISGRVYFVGSRLYQVVVAGDYRTVNSAAARQFFDSFAFEIPPPQTRLADLLDTSEIEYDLDEDGDYAVTIAFTEEGRSQSVYLSERTSGITGRPYFTAISFIYGDDSPPPSDLLAELLYMSGTFEMGRFIMYEDRNGEQVVAFLAEIQPDLDSLTFREAVFYVAAVADDVEKELFGTDDF